MMGVYPLCPDQSLLAVMQGESKADMQAFKKLKDPELIRERVGHVPGVRVGQVFKNRGEVRDMTSSCPAAWQEAMPASVHSYLPAPPTMGRHSGAALFMYVT
jgi:hypothetical protein